MKILALCLLVPATLAAKEYPRPTAEYSADVTMTMESGGRTFTMAGKVYSTKDRERREIDAMGQLSVVISRLDTKTTLVLMPAQKMYMETPPGAAGGMPGGPGGPGASDPIVSWQNADVTLKELGKEKVNGVDTTKFEMSMKVKGAPTNATLWLTAEKIPMRFQGSMEGPQGSGRFTMEAKNLKIGKQPAALFEVPAGFEKFTMPAGGGHW